MILIALRATAMSKIGRKTAAGSDGLGGIVTFAGPGWTLGGGGDTVAGLVAAVEHGMQAYIGGTREVRAQRSAAASGSAKRKAAREGGRGGNKRAAPAGGLSTRKSPKDVIGLDTSSEDDDDPEEDGARGATPSRRGVGKSVRRRSMRATVTTMPEGIETDPLFFLLLLLLKRRCPPPTRTCTSRASWTTARTWRAGTGSPRSRRHRLVISLPPTKLTTGTQGMDDGEDNNRLQEGAKAPELRELKQVEQELKAQAGQSFARNGGRGIRTRGGTEVSSLPSAVEGVGRPEEAGRLGLRDAFF